MFARVSLVKRFSSLLCLRSLAEHFSSIRFRLLCEIHGFLKGWAMPGLVAAISSAHSQNKVCCFASATATLKK